MSCMPQAEGKALVLHYGCSSWRECLRFSLCSKSLLACLTPSQAVQQSHTFYSLLCVSCSIWRKCHQCWLDSAFSDIVWLEHKCLALGGSSWPAAAHTMWCHGMLGLKRQGLDK